MNESGIAKGHPADVNGKKAVSVEQVRCRKNEKAEGKKQDLVQGCIRDFEPVDYPCSQPAKQVACPGTDDQLQNQGTGNNPESRGLVRLDQINQCNG
ncbi:hypothetical protein DSECCO2_320650 [anaerobic digester metagenome]